jgi:Protein of unknown function (DUF2637)
VTGMRKAALAAITLLVAAASLTSFAESYRALLDWATRHGLHGGWALAWPLQVDTFIAVGELALFVALADQWAARSRAAAWSVTLAGLAVSVAGNVGHVQSHDLASQATAAVPPLAAAAALAVGLGVLKRVVSASEQAATKATREAIVKATPKPRTKASRTGADAATRAATEAARQGQPVPSARALARAHHIGRDRANQIRTTVLAAADGHGGQPAQLTST